jgi:hypothetical protein
MSYPWWNIHRLNRRHAPECCCGRKSWTIEVAASKVKAAVKRQLATWELVMRPIQSELDAIGVILDKAPCGDAWDAFFELNRNLYDRRRQLDRRKSEVQPDVEKWQKWDAFLASMPDDEMLELTRDDHELFFYGKEIDAV